MSTWQRYVDLIDGEQALTTQRDARIAQAQHQHDGEIRKIERTLALQQKESKQLHDRIQRLQSESRSVIRQLGLTQPHTGSTDPDQFLSDIPEAVKSAEYDLKQLRRGLQNLQLMRQQQLTAPPRTMLPAPTPPVPAPPSATPQSPRKTAKPRTILMVAAAVVAVLLVVLLLAVI
ncbi:hypothetical protein [Nesterenkonia muleiensis]|uniref:hypothetical protein n=1 Tax=Nesterenkonia muleiensis TaxID=2282648 RepID=UPI000E723D7A|nr:hypothetical protein [Nesterenkonia muleiensis]